MKNITLKLTGENDFFTQEAYKVLRTNLQFCGQDIKVIALTSCNENEGKTTVSLGLGKCLAELDKKVLVIDGDMRKSVIVGRNTDSQKVVGLSELLSGQESINDCIYKTQYPNLHLLFAGKYPPNPTELLNGRTFSVLIEALRKHYDYILIDTPPLGQVIDAAVIATQCDGSVLVIGSSRIHRTQAMDVVEQLKKSGSKVLGVIRNNAKKGGRGYYRYGYGKKYGYGKRYGYGKQV
ncbi:MAG: CpsD/CapB family tyrosine-protein kinase [Eubacteriales bacterium]|nr:CpsD/CapB family tyrosine-protein kinase [Eubacteriales bacterium]